LLFSLFRNEVFAKSSFFTKIEIDYKKNFNSLFYKRGDGQRAAHSGFGHGTAPWGWRGHLGQLGRPAALSTYKDATPLAAFLFLLNLSFTPRPPSRSSLGLRPSSPTIADRHRRAWVLREAFLSIRLHTHRRPLIPPLANSRLPLSAQSCQRMRASGRVLPCYSPPRASTPLQQPLSSNGDSSRLGPAESLLVHYTAVPPRRASATCHLASIAVSPRSS